MVPTVALPPAMLLTAQVTDWFWAPDTVAAYCALAPTLTVEGPVTLTCAEMTGVERT